MKQWIGAENFNLQRINERKINKLQGKKLATIKEKCRHVSCVKWMQTTFFKWYFLWMTILAQSHWNCNNDSLPRANSKPTVGVHTTNRVRVCVFMNTFYKQTLNKMEWSTVPLWYALHTFPSYQFTIFLLLLIFYSQHWSKHNVQIDRLTAEINQLIDCSETKAKVITTCVNVYDFGKKSKFAINCLTNVFDSVQSRFKTNKHCTLHKSSRMVHAVFGACSV